MKRTGGDPLEMRAVDEDDAGFEVLADRPWRIPRWLVAAVAVLTVVAGTTAVIKVAGSLGRVGSAGRPLGSTVPPPTPTVRTVPGMRPLDLPGGQPVDLALGARHLYVLTSLPSALLTVSKIDVGDGHVDDTVDVPIGAGRLIVDEELGRLWVLISEQDRGVVLEFDSSTLRPTNSVSIPAAVQGVAVLDHRLWVATWAAGLYSLAPGARALVRSPVRCGCTAITADPGNRRLILTFGAWPAQVASYRPADGRVVTGESLDLGKTSLAVVRGTVWVAGYGNDRVARLDPSTLRFAAHGPSDQDVEAGGVVWPGQGVVWIGGDERRLRCVDPASGRLLGDEPYGPGPVVSRTGAVFVVIPGLVGRLELAPGCGG